MMSHQIMIIKKEKEIRLEPMINPESEMYSNPKESFTKEVQQQV